MFFGQIVREEIHAKSEHIDDRTTECVDAARINAQFQLKIGEDIAEKSNQTKDDKNQPQMHNEVLWDLIQDIVDRSGCCQNIGVVGWDVREHSLVEKSKKVRCWINGDTVLMCFPGEVSLKIPRLH